MRSLFAVAIVLLAVDRPPAQQEPDAFSFLPGLWSMRKDGFSFTVRYEPIFAGAGYREVVLLDETNRVVSQALLTFDARERTWTKHWVDASGERATFVGVDGPGDPILEMRRFGDQVQRPVRARLVFQDVAADSFTVDWQSRDDGHADWQPRSVPFVHRRVERPEPATGAGRIAFISKRTGDWEVYTMAPDGSDVRNLSDHVGFDHRPTWIAGGTRLAFSSQRGVGDDEPWRRWERDVDGSDLELVDLPAACGRIEFGVFPEVHPNGSHVVYAAERDGDWQLFVSRFDGGGERPLAHAAGRDGRPSWSPDGREVLFESERDGNPELYVVEVDSGDVRRLTDSAGLERYAAWSPDGSRIVFASDRADGKSLELYVIDADGSGVRRLTDNDAEDGEPSWSPDGRRIVFRSNASGNPEICVVDLDSGRIVNISNDPAYDGEPSWSPAAPR